MRPLRPLDVPRLAREFQGARPFPFIQIDDFLEREFALEVTAAYPQFEEAARIGKAFESVNEHRKIQVTDAALFPPPVQRLNAALAAPEFLDQLATITGIPELLADEALAGGGMHQTGPRGRLDVHVDFNLLGQKRLHRRLNILLYLNPVWERAWGGHLELWDADVKVCHHSIAPVLNRCVIFETSATSYHGVEQVTCPPAVTRKSFAGYYYTVAPPPGWDGTRHSTQFRARPAERVKSWFLMPLEHAGARWRRSVTRCKQAVKRLAGG